MAEAKRGLQSRHSALHPSWWSPISLEGGGWKISAQAYSSLHAKFNERNKRNHLPNRYYTTQNASAPFLVKARQLPSLCGCDRGWKTHLEGLKMCSATLLSQPDSKTHTHLVSFPVWADRWKASLFLRLCLELHGIQETGMGRMIEQRSFWKSNSILASAQPCLVLRT